MQPPYESEPKSNRQTFWMDLTHRASQRGFGSRDVSNVQASSILWPPLPHSPEGLNGPKLVDNGFCGQLKFSDCCDDLPETGNWYQKTTKQNFMNYVASPICD